MQPERDYTVGYGKPPEHARFQKGHSGNPRGRPRGAKNLAILLNEALDEKVTVNENGRRRKLSKRAAIIGQLVNRSTQADLKAIHLLLGLLHEIEHRAGGHTEPTGLSEADRQVLRFLNQRGLGDEPGESNVRS